jgi:3D (Asp-Asp-Asp) domain-containing protein
MNQMLNRRFTRGLSLSMSILASVTVGYLLTGNLESVRAADNPAAAKSPEKKSIDVPGTFKDLPAAKDSVTSKSAAPHARAAARTQMNVAQLTIDESKGVTARAPVKGDARRSATSASRTVSDRGAAPASLDTAGSAAPGVANDPNADEIEATDADFEDYHATAYCLQGRTASGEQVKPGIIAADPRVLPLGTVVHIRAGRYTGTYTVMDTGGRIRGRHVDVYVPTYKEAKAFGRRPVKIKVISRAGRKSGPESGGTILTESK